MKVLKGSRAYFEKIESLIKEGKTIEALEFFNLTLYRLNTDGYIEGYEKARNDATKAIKKMNRGI